MKKFMMALFVSTSFFMTSCSDDDDNGNVIGEEEESVTYELRSAADGTAVGNVTIENNTDGTVTTIVEMDNAEAGQEVDLHQNTAAETGPVVLTLNDIDETGTSTTTFSTFDDGTEVNYQELLTYDGYIDVHNEGETESIAYADIGMNELTGESKTYQLVSSDGSEMEGTVTFEKRVDNTTMATVDVNGTMEAGNYPVYFYADNSLEGDLELLQLNNIVNETGRSITQIDVLNDDSDVTYDDLMNYDGHIKVNQEMDGEENAWATADIGQNEFSGNSETYALTEVDGSGITGTLTFNERLNGETVATVNLDNTVAGEDHAAFINSGVLGTETSIPTVMLNNVIGATGTSQTNLTALDDGTEMDYDAFLEYDGNATILQSSDPVSEVVAEGNIGMNAE